MSTPKYCSRVDPQRLTIKHSIPNTIFANEDVLIEDVAIEELLHLLELQETAEQMYQACPELFSEKPGIERISLSPDFHKGSGIPIGTSMLTKGMVIPGAVGNDVNCGVRLYKTSLKKDQFLAAIDQLEAPLRHIFFEGGRNIPLTLEQRQNIICSGLQNLEKVSDDGLWKYFDSEQHQVDLDHCRHRGGFDTAGLSFGLQDYLSDDRIMRDSSIGSIGGGNHFVEIQSVEKIHKASAAHAFGLSKDQVVVMVHSGSLNVGHLCGSFYRNECKRIYPSSLKYPSNGIFPLPNKAPEYKTFWTALHNAANFAFVNRFFLGLMVKRVLTEQFGALEMPLLYDSPHNLAWATEQQKYLHRKGACPAGGLDTGPFQWHGEPVMVPGSMGSPSFILEGQGQEEALFSASHGAGRKLSRGHALKHDDREFKSFLASSHVITPVDPNRADLRGRRDIQQKYYDDLKKEAPFAYKDVYPVVNTLKDSGVASPVAEMQPLLTLKS
ncbi:MAG: RtcB family protein [Planctomycetota bacterium]|nr:RtcB family protein [Planctomycetota bacterium]